MSTGRPEVTIRDPLALFIELAATVVIVEDLPDGCYRWTADLRPCDLTTDRTWRRRKVYQDTFADGLVAALAERT